MSHVTPPDNIAVFCDYENIAIGAASLPGGRVDVGALLEPLRQHGTPIVKKAYCDWTRYAGARRPLHRAGFELIEVPEPRFSGKNSADIRLVVDALDLSHTLDHISTFAIISGDSDFSPLVSKLRASGRTVVGLGLRDSTSTLLAETCDVFLFYDDLVASRRQQPQQPAAVADTRTAREAIRLVIRTAEALLADRDSPVWGSHIKQVIQQERPRFSERRYGFSSFSELLQAASERDELDIQPDQRSGGYIVTSVH